MGRHFNFLDKYNIRKENIFKTSNNLNKCENKCENMRVEDSYAERLYGSEESLDLKSRMPKPNSSDLYEKNTLYKKNKFNVESNARADNENKRDQILEEIEEIAKKENELIKQENRSISQENEAVKQENELIKQGLEILDEKSIDIIESENMENQPSIKVKNCKRYESFYSKLKGLMFSMEQKNLAFVFYKERFVPLHMMFVFYPIDVVYLDKNKKVVEIKENLRPFQFYRPLRKAMYVLELEKGFIKNNCIRMGQRIDF